MELIKTIAVKNVDTCWYWKCASFQDVTGVLEVCDMEEGQNVVPLTLLIDYLVQKTYHDLIVLSELWAIFVLRPNMISRVILWNFEIVHRFVLFLGFSFTWFWDIWMAITMWWW